MKIIELTQSHNGQHNPIWLNVDEICYMEMIYKPDETYTRIYIRSGSGSFGVIQTPDEIIELIKKA